MKRLLIVIMAFALALPVPAHGWSGRRAVLYSEGLVMLAANEPYRWGATDCSGQMWRLLKKVFPELGLTKCFRRTTADAMAGWPWEPLMSLDDAAFGDLLFCGSPRISHVLMAWDEPGTAVHASKTRGFSRTSLRPYWHPRIILAIRPPY